MNYYKYICSRMDFYGISFELDKNQIIIFIFRVNLIKY